MAWNESMQNELTVLSPLQGRLPAPGPCWGRRGGGTLDRIRKQWVNKNKNQPLLHFLCDSSYKTKLTGFTFMGSVWWWGFANLSCFKTVFSLKLSEDLLTLRSWEWFNLPKTTCTKWNVSVLQQSLVSADARNWLCSCLLKQGVHSITLLWPVHGISSDVSLTVILNKNVNICDGYSAAEKVYGWKTCPNSSSWIRSSTLFQKTLN